MKTAIEIYEIREHIERCSTDSKVDEKEVIKLAMKDYAKEVIDEILSRSDMIYITYDEDEEPEEAVYNYEAFDEFKRQLK